MVFAHKLLYAFECDATLDTKKTTGLYGPFISLYSPLSYRFGCEPQNLMAQAEAEKVHLTGTLLQEEGAHHGPWENWHLENLPIEPIWATNKKKNRPDTDSMKYYLFNKDPYFMAYYNPYHNWVVCHPL